MRRAMIGTALALLLAACSGGSSDDGGTTDTTSPTGTVTTVTTPATGGLDDLEGDLNGCGVPDRDLNPDGSCPS